MQKIIIVGAGYGGIVAALGLEKKFGMSKNVSITLIDRHDYQLYAANLYEVAAAEEELTTVKELKRSIALPFWEVFKGKNIKLIQAEVTNINPVQKTVQAGIQKLEYDFLVLATGSVSDYFGIEGAEKFALPLKRLSDGLRVRNQIEFAIQRHRLDMSKKNIRIVVAGGGYTGVEFAGELPRLLDMVAWKNEYPREKIEVTIVEAMPMLLPGLSPRMSADAYTRLRDLNIRVQLSSRIAKIDEHFVELDSREKMEYDLLVWTTGVKPAVFPISEPIELDRKGRVVVNTFLQVEKYGNIFGLGDNACIINSDGRPAPPTAQDAIEQGEYVSYALPYVMKNKKPKKPYRGKPHGYIVVMGGQWAILNYGGFYFSGRLAYYIRELAALNYYRKVVGLWKAIKYVVFQVTIHSRNN